MARHSGVDNPCLTLFECLYPRGPSPRQTGFCHDGKEVTTGQNTTLNGATATPSAETESRPWRTHFRSSLNEGGIADDLLRAYPESLIINRRRLMGFLAGAVTAGIVTK